METKEINFLTLLGYVHKLDIPVFTLDQNVHCDFSIDEELGRGGSMAVYKGTCTILRKDGYKQFIQAAFKIPYEKIIDKTPDRKLNKILADVRQELRMMKHLEDH